MERLLPRWPQLLDGRRLLLHGASAAATCGRRRLLPGRRWMLIHGRRRLLHVAAAVATWATASATIGGGCCYMRRRRLLPAGRRLLHRRRPMLHVAAAAAATIDAGGCYKGWRQLLQAAAAAVATNGASPCVQPRDGGAACDGPWCYRRRRRFFQRGVAELTARGGIAAGATGGPASETQLCRRGCKLVCGTKRNSFQSFFLHAGHH
jgi:hypothetical protein